jgi:hypothetical protein
MRVDVLLIGFRFVGDDVSTCLTILWVTHSHAHMRLLDRD